LRGPAARSAGCYLHPFESRTPQGRQSARRGGAVRGEREIYFGLMELAKWPKKIYCARLAVPGLLHRVVVISAPAFGLKGVKTARRIDEQEPAAMTKRAGARRHCPLAPVVLSPAVRAA